MCSQQCIDTVGCTESPVIHCHEYPYGMAMQWLSYGLHCAAKAEIRLDGDGGP